MRLIRIFYFLFLFFYCPSFSFQPLKTEFRPLILAWLGASGCCTANSTSTAALVVDGWAQSVDSQPLNKPVCCGASGPPLGVSDEKKWGRGCVWVCVCARLAAVESVSLPPSGTQSTGSQQFVLMCRVCVCVRTYTS